MSDSWSAPDVYQGDIILWHDGHNATATGFTALVTSTGRDGIVDLIAFPSSAYNGIPKSGVRYHEDPNKHAIHSQEDGVWSFTERYKNRNRLAPAKPR